VNGHVAIEVADDGVGGADAASGSGLRGLADRLDALEGRLTVESEPGSGTRVLAEIPRLSQRPPTGGPVEGAWGNREVPPAELG
jgi:glucose-6-phosphate-specific signal transduction histidine kinase